MHRMTYIYSGSWKIDCEIEEGEIDFGDPYNLQTEVFIEAECSCGKSFVLEEEANKHRFKVKRGLDDVED